MVEALGGVNVLDQPIGTVGTRPRMSGAARRGVLIAAAETLFLDKGYHATTMDDIARVARMSKKTVYQVCPTKLALFEAFLLERFSPFTVPIEADGRGPRAVLTAALRRMVGLAVDARHVALTRLLIAETPQSEDIALTLERHCISAGKSALRQWLAEQAALGTLRVDDPEQAAATLFFAATGDFLFGLLLRTDRAPGRAAIEAQVERTVAMFLGVAG